MDKENYYYDQQKELSILKQQLGAMEKQIRMKHLNKQLNKLMELKDQLANEIPNFNENVEFINRNIESVEPILNNDLKINMNQECAENMKKIVQTTSILSNYRQTAVHLKKTNLDSDTETLNQNIASRILTATANLDYIAMLITNVQKLTNSELSNQIIIPATTIGHNQQDCTLPTENSSDTLNFSQVPTSSPAQNGNQNKEDEKKIV